MIPRMIPYLELDLDFTVLEEGIIVTVFFGLLMWGLYDLINNERQNTKESYKRLHICYYNTYYYDNI